MIIDDQAPPPVQGDGVEVELLPAGVFGHGQGEDGQDEVSVAEQQGDAPEHAVSVRVEAHVPHPASRLE